MKGISTLLFSISFLVLSTSSCTPKFDPAGMNNISNINGRLGELMNKATGSYNTHSTAVEALLADMDKSYEHAKAIKGNKEIAESWRILKVDLVAPFFEKWKKEGKLDNDYIREAAVQVNKSVAAITTAEKAKRK